MSILYNKLQFFMALASNYVVINIKLYRKNLGLSQTKLAEKTVKV